MYQYGGIYFDTDVEVIKSMDSIVDDGAFMGREAGLLKLAVAPGLGIGAEAHHPFYKEILEYYRTLEFIMPDGSYNTQTVVNYITKLLKEHGLKENDNIQEVAGIKIYPEDYFCPMHAWTKELKITPNTRTIHHYAASWISEERKQMNEEIKHLSRYMGRTLAGIWVVYQQVIKKMDCVEHGILQKRN